MITALTLKQFVPSDFCLKCEGCCRFKQADSSWRPKLGEMDRQQLGACISTGSVLDPEGYMTTIPGAHQHTCRFLNLTDNTCGVYAKRPLECSLYPLIFSLTKGTVKVYAHWGCPYVQDHQSQADFNTFVDEMKVFLRQGTVREYLIKNKAMFHDYTSYENELLYLFDIELL